jgi:hypothetical protein
MNASLYSLNEQCDANNVTKIVTKNQGNPGQSRGNCHQNCNQTEGTLGQHRAIGSTTSGHRGPGRVIRGNPTFGLITQRSQVQILPPQPTHSIGLKLDSAALETVTNFGATSRKSLILKSQNWLQHVGFRRFGALGRVGQLNQSVSEKSLLVRVHIVTNYVTNFARKPSSCVFRRSTVSTISGTPQ